MAQKYKQQSEDMEKRVQSLRTRENQLLTSMANRTDEIRQLSQRVSEATAARDAANATRDDLQQKLRTVEESLEAAEAQIQKLNQDADGEDDDGEREHDED